MLCQCCPMSCSSHTNIVSSCVDVISRVRVCVRDKKEGTYLCPSRAGVIHSCTDVIPSKVEDARNAPPLYKQTLLFLIVLIPPHHVRKSQICLVRVKVYDCSYTWYKQFSVILNFEGEIKEKSYIFKKHLFMFSS